MEFCALQPEPERPDYGNEVRSAIRGEYDTANRLLKLIAEHVPQTDAALEACELVKELHRHARVQRASLEGELAWRKWTLARLYFSLTGIHMEMETPRGRPNPKVDGNVYDIRDLLRQLR